MFTFLVNIFYVNFNVKITVLFGNLELSLIFPYRFHNGPADESYNVNGMGDAMWRNNQQSFHRPHYNPMQMLQRPMQMQHRPMDPRMFNNFDDIDLNYQVRQYNQHSDYHQYY